MENDWIKVGNWNEYQTEAVFKFAKLHDILIWRIGAAKFRWNAQEQVLQVEEWAEQMPNIENNK